MRILPVWLVVLILLPLQIWFSIELWRAYGFWTLVAIGIVLGVLGTRASRAHWLKAAFFPHWAMRWEQRRHIFQGILFLLAAGAYLLAAAPQPWIPAGLTAWLVRGHPWLAGMTLISLLKAALR